MNSLEGKLKDLRKALDQFKKASDKKSCCCDKVKKSEEISYLDNGQWVLEKSKYPGVYDINDNARRKANNIDADSSPIQAAPRVKKWGGSGVNAVDREVKDMKRKSRKSPVKTYNKEDYSPEEWSRMTGEKAPTQDNVVQLPQPVKNDKKAA